MRATVLIEDESIRDGIGAEHGLSIYIERKDDSLLFDVGGSDLFANNARMLNLSISNVGALFLSHGHCDHTGGLPTFLHLNTTAKIYATPLTFRPYYSLRKNGVFEDIGAPACGIDVQSDRVVLNRGYLGIEQGMFLFSDVKTMEFLSDANRNLFMIAESYEGSDFERGANGDPNTLVNDRFEHEQSMIVTSESGKKVLIVGCSHRGIVNIMNRCIEILGTAPDYVVGGFHWMIPCKDETIASENLVRMAERLAAYPTKYFVGHCVGRDAFACVQPILKENIFYFGSGDSFEF